MNQRREQARELRQQGMSVKEIARTMEASVGSVSAWVRDIVLTDAQVENLKNRQRRIGGQHKGAQANRQKFKLLRQQYQEAGREKAREGRPLHQMGCMLYWAEGAKGRTSTYFVNSDPDMLCFFARFLREELGVTSQEIKIHILCHTLDSEEIKRIETYWLDLLQLSSTSLGKTVFKTGSKVRHTTLHNGVCSLRVYRADITHHIYGAIQEYGNFERSEWLF
jgi:DNA-binding transcriptional MerR regulator